MGLCNCPSTTLEAIPTSTCSFDLKQLQKSIFQKIGSSFDTAAGTPTDPTLKADWDTFIAATDNTKAVVTPFIRDVKIAAGDFITEGGGDNTTLNGVEEINGTNPSAVTGMFRSITPEQEKSLKKLMCDPLHVYLINQNGRIFGKKVSATVTTGIPVQALGVKDRTNEGFGTKDVNEIQFSLAAGWSEDLVEITPADFNALTDL